MPTPSTKLQMNIFATSDTFSTAQLDQNFQILDTQPGILIVTSTTRPGMAGGPPAWGTNQNGMRIIESDTLLTWLWNGTTFVRTWPTGSLGRISGTANLSTSTTWTPPGTGTLTTALTLTVHPPAGNRLLEIRAEVPEVGNPNGLSYIAIQRDASILTSYPVWTSQQTGSGNSGNAGSKGDYTTFDQPNEATAVYTLKYAAATVTGGQTTLVAAPTRPIALTVVEV